MRDANKSTVCRVEIRVLLEITPNKPFRLEVFHGLLPVRGTNPWMARLLPAVVFKRLNYKEMGRLNLFGRSIRIRRRHL
jgi:hypothetical protein